MLLILEDESSYKEFMTTIYIMSAAEGTTQYLSDKNLKKKIDEIKPDIFPAVCLIDNDTPNPPMDEVFFFSENALRKKIKPKNIQ
ncbi:hypothetical protein [Dryocola sp. BD626]|uniref:hypothetical protein n=1 Tax=Dryocola sp. BD626 TaxID=3133273 RepID=UPI003F50CD19